MTARYVSAPSFLSRLRADVRPVIDCWPVLWRYLRSERRVTT